MSAKAIQHRWKHEILIHPLRRRASMTRAVPAQHISARTVAFGRLTGPERLHWMKMSTPGPTRLPDNDIDDIASFTSLQTTAVDTPSFWTFAYAPLQGVTVYVATTRWTKRNCSRSTASVLSQLPAHSISNTRCTGSTTYVEHHLQQHRWLTGCDGPASTNTFALRGSTRDFSLQVTDLAQGWSDTVSAQNSLTDLLAVEASVCIRKCWVLLQCNLGESNTLSLYSRKDRSFTKKLSSCSNLSLKWQSLHLQSGQEFTDCVAPYDDDWHNTNKMKSRKHFVASPIALRMLILTHANSALPPNLTKSALQPWCITRNLVCVPARDHPPMSCVSCPPASNSQVAPVV